MFCPQTRSAVFWSDGKIWFGGGYTIIPLTWVWSSLCFTSPSFAVSVHKACSDSMLPGVYLLPWTKQHEMEFKAITGYKYLRKDQFPPKSQAAEILFSLASYVEVKYHFTSQRKKSLVAGIRSYLSLDAVPPLLPSQHGETVIVVEWARPLVSLSSAAKALCSTY